MGNITLLDTAIGSSNRGDDIIMLSAEDELSNIMRGYFTIHVPTHLRAFSSLECLGNLPDSAREVYNSKYKFVCGTNLLSGNMLKRSNQWNIHYFNVRPICGCVLVGVGASASHADWYTQLLYRKVLSSDYFHSVRDKKAYDLISGMGLKCLYTGCVSMWKLTPSFCKLIPTVKRPNVIFTLTDYKRDPEKDKIIISTLRKNYKKIFFWLQGAHDLEYINELTDTSDITMIPSTVKDYSRIFGFTQPGDAVDYVGTRLHAGIFAMRHSVRTIIIRVDSRMDEMACCIPNNTIARDDIINLESMILSDLHTECCLDWESIKQWKEQFS